MEKFSSIAAGARSFVHLVKDLRADGIELKTLRYTIGPDEKVGKTYLF